MADREEVLRIAREVSVRHKGILDRLEHAELRERVPVYLMEMPKRVLFGSCRGIEKWCRDNDKERPTLLDLANARKARKGERR